MKRQLQRLFMAATLTVSVFAAKGQRYLTEIFPNVNATTNVIYGNNAQGKTNILDAIY